MAAAPTGPIKAWSYSRWNTYNNCPAQANYKFVLKWPVPDQGVIPAIERGIGFHSHMEKIVAGVVPEKPADLERMKTYEAEFKTKVPKLFKKEIAEAKKGKPITEAEWTFRNDWSHTGWFAKDAWCRVKTDLAFHGKKELVIVDHKTGRKNSDHLTQLSLYALAGFLKFPSIDHIGARLWYLDHGPDAMPMESYERDELPHMIDSWEERTAPMLRDTVFIPTPNNGCRWCDFSASKGGPCKF